MLEYDDISVFCEPATENKAVNYSTAVQQFNKSQAQRGSSSQQHGKPTTYILGYSMVKDIKDFKMAKDHWK